jgi:hypothetical protein
MTKKDKKKQAGNVLSDVERDWQPLFAQLIEVAEWALDIAAKLSRDYDEDQEAIENVRAFVRGWLDGRPVELPLTDLLTAIAILLSAIEIDLGVDSVTLLAPLRTALDTPSKLPAVLRCPGVAHDSKPTVVIHRFPGRRNASAASTHLAA